jgi:hypothetical protein
VFEEITERKERKRVNIKIHCVWEGIRHNNTLKAVE